MSTPATAVDLAVTLAGLSLPNPVMVASGGVATGRELAPFVDVGALGAVVTRSVTLDRSAGSPMPRIVETASGVLHAGGLQSPGLQGFLATELPWLAQRRARTVVSIAATSLGEYAELGRRVGDSPGVSAVEVNLACPNHDANGRLFSREPYQAAKVLNAVRRDVPHGVPVLAKLDAEPGVVTMAQALVKAGADGLVLVNGVPGMAIDPSTLRPALGAGVGQLSGPAIGPLAVRCVWDVHAALPEVALVGVGGVRTGFDALELLLAGASAVQVGSILLHDPSAPARILRELHEELAGRGLTSVADVVGRAHRLEGEQP